MPWVVLLVVGRLRVGCLLLWGFRSGVWRSLLEKLVGSAEFRELVLSAGGHLASAVGDFNAAGSVVCGVWEVRCWLFGVAGGTAVSCVTGSVEGFR